MVQRQIARLEERMEKLAAGDAEVDRSEGTQCRTCAKKECMGTCWGFWVDEGRASHHDFRTRAKDQAEEAETEIGDTAQAGDDAPAGAGSKTCVPPTAADAERARAGAGVSV